MIIVIISILPNTGDGYYIYVFYGSAVGLNTNCTLKTANDLLLGLGDVNGDTYDDVLITMWKYSRIYVYYGNPLGFSTNNMWTYSTNNGRTNDPPVVSMLGDINGDNLNDFAVLSPEIYDDACKNIYIFLGNKGIRGINSKPDLSLGTSLFTNGTLEGYIHYIGLLSMED